MGATRHPTDRDVVVVGGGPAGSTAGVFAARYGFDTLVLDRGAAALPRCAYLENYPGFPGGIGVDAFRDLLHAHLAEAGATLAEEQVVAVECRDGGPGFAVETDADRRLTSRYVVAAAWYDGSYLRPLDDGAMFTEQEHHGETEVRFDPEYADADGRTPRDGLYVASPADQRSAQAVVAAGNGAHVARALVADDRRAEGFAGEVAPHYDWLRSESEFAGEWADRERWHEWFDAEVDASDLDDDRQATLRERYVDRAFETKRSNEAVADASRRGLRLLVETLGTETVLDAVDDDAIRAYLDGAAAESPK